jgi:hypothetical protein
MQSMRLTPNQMLGTEPSLAPEFCNSAPREHTLFDVKQHVSPRCGAAAFMEKGRPGPLRYRFRTLRETRRAR